MKILVRLPTWLGDAVMATPALELLHDRFSHAQFTYIGSPVSCALFERDSRVSRLIVDDSKKAKSRLKGILHIAKRAGRHDVALTFQNNFLSALLLFLTRTPRRLGYAKEWRSFLLSDSLQTPSSLHQVERYARLLEPLIGALSEIPPLNVTHQPRPKPLLVPKLIGINPGAAYGSAKRWPEAHFAHLISSLLQEGYGVMLFGGEGEREGNERILRSLEPSPLLLDLTAQTDLSQLIDVIGTLDLFITNDSGPMHLACALGIPLIALFGPTDSKETSPWKPMSETLLLSKHLPCAPCKKRICPLGHHHCMTLLAPQEVLTAVFQVLGDS